jgi:hypothetical protein
MVYSVQFVLGSLSFILFSHQIFSRVSQNLKAVTLPNKLGVFGSDIYPTEDMKYTVYCFTRNPAYTVHRAMVCRSIVALKLTFMVDGGPHF